MVSKTTHLNAYIRPAKSVWMLPSPMRSAKGVETRGVCYGQLCYTNLENSHYLYNEASSESSEVVI